MVSPKAADSAAGARSASGPGAWLQCAAGAESAGDDDRGPDCGPSDLGPAVVAGRLDRNESGGVAHGKPRAYQTPSTRREAIKASGNLQKIERQRLESDEHARRFGSRRYPLTTALAWLHLACNAPSTALSASPPPRRSTSAMKVSAFGRKNPSRGQSVPICGGFFRLAAFLRYAL